MRWSFRPSVAAIMLFLLKDKDTMDSFISRVDDALYLAKEQGRNTVVVG